MRGVREPVLVVVVVPGSIGALACESRPPTGEFGDLPAAIVYGTVADPAGQPVAGASVTVEHRREGCQEIWIERDLAATGPTGSYRSVFVLGENFRVTSCFVVLADPPAGSGLRPSPVIPFEVDLHPGFPDDSVRVGVTLADE